MNTDGEKSKLLHQTTGITNVFITFVHFYKHARTAGTTWERMYPHVSAETYVPTCSRWTFVN